MKTKLAAGTFALGVLAWGSAAHAGAPTPFTDDLFVDFNGLRTNCVIWASISDSVTHRRPRPMFKAVITKA
jgi:hypothetical protein